MSTGRLRWVNAGHPPPLLLRAGRVVGDLASPPTLPVGFGGAAPIVTETRLRRGDRVLFYTDGLIEGHSEGGAEFGEGRLRDRIERVERQRASVQETVWRLSHVLMLERGATTDDSTSLLFESRGGTADRLVRLEEPPRRYPGDVTPRMQ